MLPAETPLGVSGDHECGLLTLGALILTADSAFCIILKLRNPVSLPFVALDSRQVSAHQRLDSTRLMRFIEGHFQIQIAVPFDRVPWALAVFTKERNLLFG